MAGGGDVAAAALLHVLEGAAADRQRHRVAGLDGGRAGEARGVELVVEPFVAEEALLLGHPLLQADVRLDAERGHGLSLLRRAASIHSNAGHSLAARIASASSAAAFASSA